MVQIIKEVLLFVTLHTYLLQAQVGYGRCPGLALLKNSTGDLTSSNRGTTCHNIIGLQLGQKCYVNCTNGYRLESNNGSYENPYYSCESVSGSSGSSGLPSASWVPEDGTFYCQRIRCEQLPDLSNTTEISPESCYQGPSYLNAQCNFTCKEGYVSKSEVSSVRCLANDTWSSPPSSVTCQRITCEPLPDILNTEISPESCTQNTSYPNTQCTFSCKKGYQSKSGVSSIRCLPNGSWSSPLSSITSCQLKRTPTGNGTVAGATIGALLAFLVIISGILYAWYKGYINCEEETREKFRQKVKSITEHPRIVHSKAQFSECMGRKDRSHDSVKYPQAAEPPLD